MEPVETIRAFIQAFLVIGVLCLFLIVSVSILLGGLLGVVGVLGAIVSELFRSLGRFFGIVRRKTEDSGSRYKTTDESQDTVKPQVDSFDPYIVLEVSREAKKGQIKEAYYQQMAKYHPDKVAHLGKELQILAEEKAKSIQQAYSMLQGA